MVQATHRAARGADDTNRTFPAVMAAAAHKSWDFEKAFEFGLSISLAGLKARSRAREIQRM